MTLLLDFGLTIIPKLLFQAAIQNPTHFTTVIFITKEKKTNKQTNNILPLLFIRCRFKLTYGKVNIVCLQRQNYSKLLAEGCTKMEIVKLFLLGHPAAGKTTLKNSLIKVTYCTILWLITIWNTCCIESDINFMHTLKYPLMLLLITKHSSYRVEEW